MPNIEWVTAFACPALGVLISSSMGFAPFPALLKARKNKNIGDLNPIPFAMITNAQLGWTTYGVVNKDFFVFFSSAIPLIVGFLLCLTAIHILERNDHTEYEEKLRIRIEGILLASAVCWLIIVMITLMVFSSDQHDLAVTIIGSFSIISSLIFYGSPLANIAEIIKTGDSSTLYAPSLMINLANCVLWFFYGLMGAKELIIWIPNTIGGSICLFELVLCYIYPAKRHNAQEELKKSGKKPEPYKGLPREGEYSDFHRGRQLFHFYDYLFKRSNSSSTLSDSTQNHDVESKIPDSDSHKTNDSTAAYSPMKD